VNRAGVLLQETGVSPPEAGRQEITVVVSVKDVVSVIKDLGDLVKSTHEIIKAVKDGTDYLKTRFPGAKKDFSALLDQMHITVNGLARVTTLITGFRFTYDGTRTTSSGELTRFNNKIVEQKGSIFELKGNIGRLKGNCREVGRLLDKLDASTKSRAWGSMFGLLAEKAEKRAKDMYRDLRTFYGNDEEMIRLIERTLKLAEKALKDVENELGPPGIAYPENLSRAATMLAAYAELFETPNGELATLAGELEAAKNQMT
jgi:hypothetical protein